MCGGCYLALLNFEIKHPLSPRCEIVRQPRPFGIAQAMIFSSLSVASFAPSLGLQYVLHLSVIFAGLYAFSSGVNKRLYEWMVQSGWTL